MNTVDTKALRALLERRARDMRLVDDAAFSDAYTDANRARVRIAEANAAIVNAAPAMLDAADERDQLRDNAAVLELALAMARNSRDGLRAENERLREVAREGLYRMMHDFSEETWCASWYNGLEHQIVRMAAHDQDAQRILDAARALGGIWTWRDGDTDCVFRDIADLDEPLRAALAPQERAPLIAPFDSSTERNQTTTPPHVARGDLPQE